MLHILCHLILLAIQLLSAIHTYPPNAHLRNPRHNRQNRQLPPDAPAPKPPKQNPRLRPLPTKTPPPIPPPRPKQPRADIHRHSDRHPKTRILHIQSRRHLLRHRRERKHAGTARGAGFSARHRRRTVSSRLYERRGKGS